MIYKSTISDISWMVNLSHKKRQEYSKAQPNFWKMAKNSDVVQAAWFEEEIDKENVIFLCANDKKGFVIGKIIDAPKVYDAGPTLMIDDFCVESSELWLTVGLSLLTEIIFQAKSKGVSQIVVVCGDHDLKKLELLEKTNLSAASKWHTKTI